MRLPEGDSKDRPAQVPMQQFEALMKRYQTELALVDNLVSRGGISGAARTIGEPISQPLWILDTNGRTVAHWSPSTVQGLSAPRLETLLELANELARPGEDAPDSCQSTKESYLLPPALQRGLTRRYLIATVEHEDTRFAWIVVAEGAHKLSPSDRCLVERGAAHVALEYGIQRRVARASSNAREALARALLSGSAPDEDLLAAGEYLGVDVSLKRVVVEIPNSGASPSALLGIAEKLGRELGAEVLMSRGSVSTTLLVEAFPEVEPVAMVDNVACAIARRLHESGDVKTIAGVSGVTPPSSLRRAQREAWEVTLCIDRFASRGHVISVDDLGPGRLFVANSDVDAVMTYVDDLLGSLLREASSRSAPLLATLQEFFDSGRSAKLAARKLGVHPNTVRQRLARTQALTGLDVANNSNDQLAAQSALLVLRLSGNPQLPHPTM